MIKIGLFVAPGSGLFFTNKPRAYSSVYLLRDYLHTKDYQVTATDLNSVLELTWNNTQLLTEAKRYCENIEKRKHIPLETVKAYLQVKSSIRIIEINTNKEHTTKAKQYILKTLYTKDNQEQLSKIQQDMLDHLIDINQLATYDVIGFSVPFDTNFLQTIYLARMIKQKNPQAKIILGGKHIIDRIEEINSLQQEGVIDTYCKGDGEEALFTFITLCEAKKQLPKEIKEQQVSIDKIIARGNEKHLPTGVYLSKGCFWNKCTFCSRFGLIPHYELKSKKVLLEEIEQLIHQGVEQIELITDALPKNYAKAIAEFLLEKKYKIRWYACYIRVKPVYDTSLLRLMNASGFDFSEVLIGVDGLTDSVLELEQKGYSMKEVEELFKNLHVTKTKVRMINNIYDFPGATYVEEIKGLHLLETYADITANYSGLELIHNAHNEIAKYPEKFGIQIMPTTEKNSYGFSYEIIQPNGLTKEEKENIKRHTEQLRISMKIITTYHLANSFAHIKLYDPKKYDIKVKTRKEQIVFETTFDEQGNNIPPQEVKTITANPTKINILKHQALVNKLQPNTTYTFDELHNLTKTTTITKALGIQKTFQAIRDLARDQFFEELECNISKQ
jgi:radical SAM superfamily enzyme YgiQ (UPF0313 family)